MTFSGETLSAIALCIGRSKSTVSREISRNSHYGVKGYCSHAAAAKSAARRQEGRTLYRLHAGPLLDAVQSGLLKRHSPQQISGRLKRVHADNRQMHISAESIYNWVQNKASSGWHKSLRKGRAKRQPRRRGEPSKQGQIIGRVGIENRPPEVATRTRFGDWEGDTVNGAVGTGAVATHVERMSRFLVAVKLENKTASHVTRRSLTAFEKAGITAHSCQTLTLDNGKEFARFEGLEKGLGFDVYFANPHAPWERGANENTNGLIREYFPKGSDFRKITKSQVDNMVMSMNNRPRKCLGYQTPREVFDILAGVALQS
jgi:IS30 family transposase